ncbi:phospholipase D-like domain-containing protein [Bacillus sp. B-jedd]|uniref:phospholipase D-like domain-containing protein n=1 Tax=Bacillus sp. B-jedd TaxID=1476857 RepID=UPI0005156F79|nr:phospholipase D-like domain-containing protein [Bacillus sp. B-jedd]CEG29225.1 phospholipase D/transphosphatidylase [Bacillus sp. B-jedd]
MFVFIFAGCVLLLIAWLAADLHFGRKQRLEKAGYDRMPMRKGAIQMFTRGSELFKDYFAELRRAERHIHVLFYIVKEDALNQEFFGILREKAQAGVEVRLLVDWIGSMALTKETAASLRQAGIHLAFSHKIKLPFPFYSSQARNHRKITVLDGVIGYLGGYNVGNEYIGGNPKLSPWRDYHLKITGESVQDLQQIFLTDWKEAFSEDLRQLPCYFCKSESGSAEHMLLPTSGFMLEEICLELLKNAKQKVFIGSPYFIPSRKLFAELIACLERGVELTILVPGIADHPLVKEASYRYLRVLIKNGARVYQYMYGFYHAKTILIDDTVCDIGSANFDKRSLFLNSEINCFIFGKKEIAQAAAIIEHDINASRELTLAELERPDPARTAKEIAARAVSLFL